MATNTPNFNLVKPDLNDNVDIAVLNGNMDIIDGALVSVGDLDDLNDVSITTPSAGQKLVFDGTNWVNLTGYVYVDTVYFTSNGTFTKATYPWLRAIKVRCQGGGGAGASTANRSTYGASGGGGGGYAESFITDIAGLDSSITVTRGAGGAAVGSTSTDNAGSGGNTSFGSLVTANGGEGANGRGSGAGAFNGKGGEGGNASGDVVFRGDGGGAASDVSSTGGKGGSSHLGGGGEGIVRIPAGATAGQPGLVYGGGGSGGQSQGSSSNASGGVGAAGIVIVELYA